MKREEDNSAWLMFKLAFLLWVIPQLIIYLSFRK